jgi:hypothetical protein
MWLLTNAQPLDRVQELMKQTFQMRRKEFLLPARNLVVLLNEWPRLLDINGQVKLFNTIKYLICLLFDLFILD